MGMFYTGRLALFKSFHSFQNRPAQLLDQETTERDRMIVEYKPTGYEPTRYESNEI